MSETDNQGLFEENNAGTGNDGVGRPEETTETTETTDNLPIDTAKLKPYWQSLRLCYVDASGIAFFTDVHVKNLDKVKIIDMSSDDFWNTPMGPGRTHNTLPVVDSKDLGYRMIPIVISLGLPGVYQPYRVNDTRLTPMQMALKYAAWLIPSSNLDRDTEPIYAGITLWDFCNKMNEAEQPVFVQWKSPTFGW